MARPNGTCDTANLNDRRRGPPALGPCLILALSPVVTGMGWCNAFLAAPNSESQHSIAGLPCWVCWQLGEDLAEVRFRGAGSEE